MKLNAQEKENAMRLTRIDDICKNTVAFTEVGNEFLEKALDDKHSADAKKFLLFSSATIVFVAMFGSVIAFIISTLNAAT